MAPQLQVEVSQRETGPALDELLGRAVDLVVGIEYDPVPVGRHRDLDRRDLLREEVLLALHPDHPAAGAETVDLGALRDEPWAAGHVGTGLDGLVRNVCNRLGGFEPTVRHRSDDGLVLAALVQSGRAVTLLPALFVRTVSGLMAKPLAQERLQRTIFTAVRRSSAGAPPIRIMRDALARAATGVVGPERL